MAVLTLLAGTILSSYFAVRAYDEKGRADKNALAATTKANEAIANANKARTEKDRADARTDEARGNLYDSHMDLTQAAWDSAQVTRILDLLKQHEPQSGEDDLRGFEWHYWNHLAHSYQMNLVRHTSSVWSEVFSPDGKRLASASKDHSVKVWNAVTGQETLTLNGHTGPVYGVALIPEGTRLASASQDGTVKIWDARPWTPELRAEQEALSIVRFYATPPIPTDALQAAILADATIIEPVRKRALEFARQWPEAKR